MTDERTEQQYPTVPKPSVNRSVHYVARGSADGKFPSVCRAAVITEVGDDWNTVGLCVINPTGFSFHPLAAGGCTYDDPTVETLGSPDCPLAAGHGSPFRYCACGWAEATLRGGTWHWAERV